MVTLRSQTERSSRQGGMMIELAVAIAILVAVVLPLAASWLADARAIRISYWRAVAMEVVDGECEVLAAGEWRHWQPGTHPYPVTTPAATNLPPGQFTLTLQDRHLRLEWKTDHRPGPGAVVRELELR